MSHLMTKPTKWHVRPAKARISLGIHPVWSESSLSAWRKLGSLATHWAHSKDSDQTGRMPRLIWVFAGRTCHFVGFVTRQFKWLRLCRFSVFFQIVLSKKNHNSWSFCLMDIFLLTPQYNNATHVNMPIHEKTCLRQFGPGKNQTSLLSYRG